MSLLKDIIIISTVTENKKSKVDLSIIEKN